MSRQKGRRSPVSITSPASQTQGVICENSHEFRTDTVERVFDRTTSTSARRSSHTRPGPPASHCRHRRGPDRPPSGAARPGKPRAPLARTAITAVLSVRDKHNRSPSRQPRRVPRRLGGPHRPPRPGRPDGVLHRHRDPDRSRSDAARPGRLRVLPARIGKTAVPLACNKRKRSHWRVTSAAGAVIAANSPCCSGQGLPRESDQCTLSQEVILPGILSIATTSSSIPYTTD